MASLPIEEYALLSDCHSAALVSRAGSVDWLCFPRFDSPSTFGRILDDDAGHWHLRPTADFETERTYLDRTLVLTTTFRTEGGTVVLTDTLVIGPNERGHDLGSDAPGALLRHVECAEGAVELDFELAPRPEYGLAHPLLRRVDGGYRARGGGSVLRLSSPVELNDDDATLRARFTLEAGETAGFALQYRHTGQPDAEPWSQAEIRRRIDDTRTGWESWSEPHQSYQGPYREMVHHSGRVLQGLTYYPTGAMISAATTSLPETVGGERNWDYRYTWVRDASFTLDALWVAACPDEAGKFFGFLADAALARIRRGGELQIMYGVGGEQDLTEQELPHLAGWRGSAPVRVGNGAWDQRQLDVYGELMDAAFRLRDSLSEEFDAPTRELLAELADVAVRRWQEQDRGIWEIRGPARHYVYSKLMCWVALDRAIRMADALDAGDRVEAWGVARSEIREAILERGYSEESGAFTQAFNGTELDASNLMMPIVGFLDADDPRMRATIEATAERLTDRHGLVYRYRSADGLEGEEGTFLLCTFWLAEAWALVGQVERARDVFESAVAYANDVGLLAEEVDAEAGTLLGNYPQAFSHIGLVNAAWAISQAEGNS